MIYSNIVPQSKLREVQSETLQVIADALVKSFGPKGSTTGFVKDMDPNSNNIVVEYTKDGYTIVKNLKFTYPIERSVQEMLTNLAHYIVKTVGDGTTSAVLLCNELFKALLENESLRNTPASDVIANFSNTIDLIKQGIEKKKWDCTIDDIYKIALIATNNNKEVAMTLKQVYDKFGLDVFIDVGISNEVDNIVKEYDGMTIEVGYAHECMVNDKEFNRATVYNPKIYCFDDPIDTPEMLNFLAAIISNNIFKAYAPNSVEDPIPTVIFCKRLSPDTSSYFESLVQLMNSVPNVPLLIVSDVYPEYIYEDIAKMCGAPFIKKYIDPNLQERDIEAGLAPTNETILDFCGSADMVQADAFKTKVIHPSKMFNEDGSYSDDYKAMVGYLESQVVKAKNENAGVNAIQEAKRRLNSFKGNMIDFLVGGMTISDRNNLKASVEDAVFNCRSAATNGVGWGANYMALSVIKEMLDFTQDPSTWTYLDILYTAYKRLACILYDKNENDVEFIKELISKGMPMNIRTGEYDGEVRSSIMSDIAVLDTINQILVLMYTTNQFLVQTPAHNPYIDRNKMLNND